jgi:hypothetical protein
MRSKRIKDKKINLEKIEDHERFDENLSFLYNSLLEKVKR